MFVYGTLGDIIKVCKRRAKNRLALSVFQRQQASLQLQFAKAICMSREEKASILPAELQNRDRGGMYFPCHHFLVFIRRANGATVAFANEKRYMDASC